MQVRPILHRKDKESPQDQPEGAQGSYQKWWVGEIRPLWRMLEPPSLRRLGQYQGISHGGKQHHTIHQRNPPHLHHRLRYIDEQRRRHHNLKLLEGNLEPHPPYDECSVQLYRPVTMSSFIVMQTTIQSYTIILASPSDFVWYCCTLKKTATL